MNISGMVKGHDVFRALTPKEVDLVSGFSSVKSYEDRAEIFRLNGSASHVFEVVEGGVYLQLPGRTQEHSMMVSEVVKGELFGLSPLLGSPRYTSSAVAHGATQVLAIEAEPLRDLLQRNSLVGFNVMNRVAEVYFARYISVIKNLQEVLNHIPLIR
jgi:signal-transduction protein with cAMP-binding, CBS, and nucleotidyltransferase domain